MSAIAALCALNCAVATVTAAQPPSPPLIAQIPTGVESQEFEPIFDQQLDQEFRVEPEFNGVQVQDREGTTQEFPLEAETPPEELRVLEVIGDRQEYDENARVVFAEGNVVVRFQNAVLTADEIQVNLNTRLAIAEGNVALQRGQQLLRGERFDYFFVQNRGYIRDAQGEVSQNALAQDLSPQPTRNYTNVSNPALLLNERLLLDQPPTDIRASGDGFNILIGDDRAIPGRPLNRDQGTVNRVRFAAEEVEFIGDRWDATNVRITNDPFSPPELEVLAETATFRKVDEFTDELVTTDTRLRFDNNVSLPVFPRTFRFDRSDDQGFFSQFSIGFDDEDRGGLYLQRRFSLYKSAKGSWTISPQYLAQKAFFPDSTLGGNDQDNTDNILTPDVFAVTSKFNYNFNPRFFINAQGSLASLNFDEVEDKLKFNLLVEQRLGNLNNPFRLSQEFNYRDRLFNGSLGFQRVQRSLGIVLRSPIYRFGNSGFSLDYQGSIQNIRAATDRAELLRTVREDNNITLNRYQGSIALNHGLPLWSGKPLAATPDAGLRFTPQPVVPYLSIGSGVRGVASFYSNSDSQLSGTAYISLQGQLGHFSRNFLDYTGFNVGYSFGTKGDTSPFLFDRLVDQRTISFGLTQQLYGPLRIGFQSSVNIDTNDAISTDYFLEYSRRTHSLLIRYNPVLEIGSFNFKINDFNWSGSTDPFVNGEVRPVIDGVIP